jgi:EmrB/QacA subfamily drug resistance transporter
MREILADRTTTFVFIASVIASSNSFITSTSIGILLPAMQRELSLDGAQMIWVVNAYSLFLSALILVGGALGDRLGRKRVFMVGIGLFTLTSAGIGLARSGETLIVARGLQGIAGALMVPTSLAVLSAAFPAEHRGRAIGLWSTFTSAAIALGPVLGGVLAGAGLWRVPFFINVVLGVVALLAASRIPATARDAGASHIDWAGALLVTLGLALLTYGLSEGPGQGWRSLPVIAGLVGGVLALALFVFLQGRLTHPLISLDLFRSPTFVGANLLTLFLYMALSAVFIFLPLNLIQAQGYPESLAGLATVPFIVLLTVLSPWSGRLVDRIGARKPLIIGSFIAGCGIAVLGFFGLTAGPADFWVTYFPGILLWGIGMGITVAPLTTAVMKSAPDEAAGSASGINNAVSNVAGVLAVAGLGAVALVSFAQFLESSAVATSLAETARQALLAEAGNLGGALVPPSVPPELVASVEAAINLAFASTFRIVMLVSAGLAWLGTFFAALLIQ